MPPAVVLVTGVSRWLGGALAAELAADPAIERVIGVDTVPPSPEMLRRLGRTEFVRADIRNPLIGKVIAAASVDTVVHMNISSTPAGSGGRVPMKELNVIGTMQLLAACQRAPSVRRFVLKSTSAVYGASSRDPAVFTETMQARAVPSGGFAKDSLDIEGYVRAFARRRPDVDVASLRFTNFIGPRIDSLLTGFFRMPVVPDRARLRRPGAAAARGRRPGGAHPRDDRRLRRHGERRRRGHAAAVPGDPPARPRRGAAARRRRWARSAGCRGGSASSTTRPSRCASSTSAASSTPRCCATEFGYTPRYTTEAALADYARTVAPGGLAAAGRVGDRRGPGRCSSAVGDTAVARSATGCGPAPPAPGLRAVRDA